MFLWYAYVLPRKLSSEKQISIKSTRTSGMYWCTIKIAVNWCCKKFKIKKIPFPYLISLWYNVTYWESKPVWKKILIVTGPDSWKGNKRRDKWRESRIATIRRF